MTRIACPHCGRPKPEFAIINGRCREDMNDEARASAQRPALTWNDIRGQRAILLEKSDWTDLPNAPLTAPQKAAWEAYRTELRNIPETFAETGPASVQWPALPS